jgi:DNA-directed RNA polymerase I and III subunit RPAC1
MSDSDGQMDTSADVKLHKKSRAKKSKQSALPEEIEDLRTRVNMGRYAPTQTATMSYHSTFSNVGYDNSFDLDEFKEGFDIQIQHYDENELVFDMIGIDAPVANAFRRILLSEVPTMAIEKVVVVNNTSIVQDEVLAHRIGLVPIRADPSLFYYSDINTVPLHQETEHTKGAPTPTSSNFLPSLQNKSVEHWDPPAQMMDNEYILFKLDVTCEKRKAPNPNNDNQEEYINHKVYSGQLEWVPIGNQKQNFKDEAKIKPVFDDILLAKLNPGENISVECYCVKGVGKMHAKWSPVATATYRMLPEITFNENITGSSAKLLKKVCPMNVFDIEDDNAIVARPRDCTMCRECLRPEDFEKKIRLSRLKQHFIFSIESVGSIPADEIFREALRIFYQKCVSSREALQRTRQQTKNRNKAPVLK